MSMDWKNFWDSKASSDNDFQATGRGLMSPVGYLHTIAEVVRLLDLRQGQILADIGCGAGLVALSLSPWLSRVQAVDISPAQIGRAQDNLRGLDNVDLQVGSITCLPLEDACVNRLLAYSVLQYLGTEISAGMALQQVSRVLKPGGRALLAANPDPAKRGAYEQVVRDRPDRGTAEKELVLLDSLLWLPQEKLLQLAEAAGLQAHIEPISTRIWQHFYMFDLVVDKPDGGRTIEPANTAR